MKFCKIHPDFKDMQNDFKVFMKDKGNEARRKEIPDLLSRLVKMDTAAERVQRFVEEFVRFSLPVGLLGPRNRKILIKEAGKLCVMKKYEMVAFDEIIGKFHFRDIAWLKRKSTRKNRGSIVSENKEYVRQFLYYFMNSFVIGLIRCNFYVTEKHHEHNKLFFYSKPVWYMITNLSMINIATMNMEPIDLSKHTVSDKTLVEGVEGGARPSRNEIRYNKRHDLVVNNPCAKLRLVPKSDSVRPIMTFYKRFIDKNTSEKKLVKVGNYLRHAKVVLRTLKRALADRQGLAVFDNYQIFEKYSRFKKGWRA